MMNIEQIADVVSQEMLMHIAIMQPELVKWNREYLRRCISKLAEHDMNPVGFLNVANIEHLKRGVLQSNARIKRNHERNTVPLYTETQLIAAQQKAAHRAGEVMRDRCEATLERIGEKDNCYGGAHAIRALPCVTLEDLKV